MVKQYGAWHLMEARNQGTLPGGGGGGGGGGAGGLEVEETIWWLSQQR